MLQVGSDAQVLASDSSNERNEYLLNMKSQFMDYAKNGVPAEALPFLVDVRNTLENNVLTLINDEKTSHVTSHGTLKEVFNTAATTYTNANSGITSTQGPAATSAGSTHSSCRAQESTDFGERQDAQAEYDSDEATVRATSAAVPCLESSYDWRASSHLAQYQTDLLHYKAAVNELIGTRTTLQTKISELADQKAVCDANQADFEEKSCAHTIAQGEANNDYVRSYNSAKTNFEAQFPIWDSQSNDRELQCKLVKTLICYVAAIHDNDDQADLQAAANACEAGSDAHDCSDVVFTHDDTPAALDLEDIPAAPCSPAFVYGAMPPGTGLADCAVCSGVPDAVAFN